MGASGCTVVWLCAGAGGVGAGGGGRWCRCRCGCWRGRCGCRRGRRGGARRGAQNLHSASREGIPLGRDALCVSPHAQRVMLCTRNARRDAFCRPGRRRGHHRLVRTVRAPAAKDLTLAARPAANEESLGPGPSFLALRRQKARVSGFSRSQRPVTAAGPGRGTIEAPELKAVAAFDIDPSEAGNFVLRRGGRRARRGARAGTSADPLATDRLSHKRQSAYHLLSELKSARRV
jgi:hypothetical protein